MSAASNLKWHYLKERAALIAALRHFFAERSIIEVDTPLLTRASSIDLHIDPMTITLPDGAQRFLITSPEYAMKRLLCEGCGDIYQLSHVFRQEEEGRKHNPEFTLIEWYRLGISFDSFIEETLSLIRIAIPSERSERLSYREAYLHYAGIDPDEASIDALRQASGLDPCDWERETLIDYIWSFQVEPHLGREGLTVIAGYPADQAALARTIHQEGRLMAERFEVYYKGIELANGYHELGDVKEQRQRLKEANEKRQQIGKNALPVDEDFLEALEKGLPDSCGVAVGFDRLLMIHLGLDSIQPLLPFGWHSA